MPTVTRARHSRKAKRPPNPNRSLSTVDLLARIDDDCPELLKACRVVGRWVWAEFAAKPDDETRAYLRELGFHWNRNRSAWQHPCGHFCAKPARSYDPRDVYGEIPAALADRKVGVA